MNAIPCIQINNANITYANKILFKDFNASIATRKWTCILGQSGIGKSTLLRLIAQSHKVSYLSQENSLLPWLSALDNVSLGARLRGKKNASDIAKAKHLLELVNLKNDGQLRPAQLSGGMKQRVALARTLFENESIVLLDEPFCSLDTLTRYHLQNLTAELLKDKTVILVTHDPMEALRLGDEIFIMSGMPATLKKVVSFNSPTPRAIDDSQVLSMHTELLHELSKPS